MAEKKRKIVILRRSMTKKEYSAFCRKNRGTSGFNTGTRVYSSEKDYKRKKRGWDNEND